MKTITPFMMELHRTLVKDRELAEQSASQYIRSLYSLNNNRAFTNLAWLKNKDAVERRLADFAESTQKTLLSVIVSVLSLVKSKPTYKRIHAHYYNQMMTKSKEQNSKDTSEKTDKQEKNWLDWDVVLAHRERLREETEDYPTENLTPGQWQNVLSYMILSLFTEFDPRRNQDYQLMDVVKDPKKATDKNKNYLTLNKPRQFLFHKYKTAKTHGTQTFPVPDSLYGVLDFYLARHPGHSKSGSFPLLVSHDGSPLTAVNAITRSLNRIFGTNVGSSMLRHIYLSNKYDVKEMNDTAEKMGHTGAVQRTYLKADADTL